MLIHALTRARIGIAAIVIQLLILSAVTHLLVTDVRNGQSRIVDRAHMIHPFVR